MIVKEAKKKKASPPHVMPPRSLPAARPHTTHPLHRLRPGLGQGGAGLGALAQDVVFLADAAKRFEGVGRGGSGEPPPAAAGRGETSAAAAATLLAAAAAAAFFSHESATFPE
jgi:hypothetical protein